MKTFKQLLLKESKTIKVSSSFKAELFEQIVEFINGMIGRGKYDQYPTEKENLEAGIAVIEIGIAALTELRDDYKSDLKNLTK